MGRKSLMPNTTMWEWVFGGGGLIAAVGAFIRKAEGLEKRLDTKQDTRTCDRIHQETKAALTQAIDRTLRVVETMEKHGEALARIETAVVYIEKGINAHRQGVRKTRLEDEENDS
jgi:hypothetical protein